MVDAVIKKDDGTIIETKLFDSINDAFNYAEAHYINYYIEFDGEPIYPIDSIESLFDPSVFKDVDA